MWRTKCHTAFSWKKGTIETGHVHNPHYWRYLQENGRDLDQVRRMNGQRPVGAGQCQDLRDMVVATRNQHLAHMSQLIHHFQHIQHVLKPQLQFFQIRFLQLEIPV